MSPIVPRRLTLRITLAYLGAITLGVLLVLYVAYQARFITAGPTIDIYTTNDVSSERLVTLEGQARNIVSIELNGRTIYTDQRGYFKETIVLENGYTIATMRAKDRYDRMVTAERSFVYQEPLADNS